MLFRPKPNLHTLEVTDAQERPITVKDTCVIFTLRGDRQLTPLFPRPKADDILEISDDEPMLLPSISRLDPVDRKPILHDIVDLCSSDSGPDTPPRPRIKIEAPKGAASSNRKPAAAGRFRKGASINVSRTEKVDRVVAFEKIPVRFPVPEVDTAFIFDFSHEDRAMEKTKGGKPKGLDTFLKAEVSHCCV